MKIHIYFKLIENNCSLSDVLIFQKMIKNDIEITYCMIKLEINQIF